MSRLSRYLFRLFTGEAMALFAVAACLLFLIQCLRIFDVISAKGQGILTLIGQALLSMPTLGIAFLYVCLGIGLGRTLKTLQMNSELQVIHSTGALRSLLTAALAYAAAGALALLLLAHVVEPLAMQKARQWTAEIAADLVGRVLTPHQFNEVTSGVTVEIGGRSSGGVLTDFFADDHRDPAAHRTYIAKSAAVQKDDEGYILRLEDGAVQYMAANKEYSQVSFARYDLALDGLTGPAEFNPSIAQTDSFSLVGTALRSGQWPVDVLDALVRRSAEGLRALAICVFVVAIAAFPSGARRRFDVPIELVVLLVAFVERATASILPGSWRYSPVSGAALILAIGLVILAFRLRPAGLRRAFA